MFNRERNEYLISIIVPIYNVEKYLEKCLTSIINQTYPNLQIILVDDGSTDTSGNICDIFAGKDKRIEVIHQENRGLVCARKRGLEIARGKYIGFVDGDDYIDENMYLELLKEIKSNNADFVHMGYWEKSSLKVNFEKKICDLSINKVQYLCSYVVNLESEELITPSIWSKLFKAELIKKCYEKVPNSQSFGEDLICLCACIFESNKMVLDPRAYYHYTVRNDSLSNNSDIKKLIQEYELYNTLCRLFKEYGCYENIKDVMDTFLKRHIWQCMSKISKYDFQIMQYLYPNPENIQGKRVVIYGAGTVGKDYYSQLRRYPNVKVVAWVDGYKKKDYYDFIKLTDKREIEELEYDYLIIAVKNQKEAYAIKDELKKEIKDEKKIIWEKPLFLS